MSQSMHGFRRILYPSAKNGGAGRVLDYSLYTHKVCSKCRQTKQVSQFRRELRNSGGIDCDGSACYDELSAKIHTRKDLEAIVAALRGAGFSVSTDRISKTVLSQDPRPWTEDGP